MSFIATDQPELVTVPGVAIAEYSPTAARLADLRSRLTNVAYDVSTGKGMDIAIRDRAEIRDLRVALEKKRVELKAPALERSRLIDAEAKRITLELEELEKPIDQQIKAEQDRRKEAQRQREYAEFGRVQAIHDAIGEIHLTVAAAVGRPSAYIAETMEAMRSQPLDPLVYQEMMPQAVAARDAALVKLDTAYRAKLHDEAEAAKVAAERAELAELRKLAAAQKSKDETAAAEAAKAERERAAAAQAALDAEAAAARREADRVAAEARAAAQAEHEAKMRSEREHAAAAKRIADEKAAKALVKQRKAEAAEQRLRDAAPRMLTALTKIRLLVDGEARQIADAAIKEAIGEVLAA